MHQTKKGNEWYFGMKVHAGVDAGSGYVHTITGTSANMHDVTETANLIRKDDEVVYGDSGYLGAVNQPAIKDDEKKSKIEFRVNKRPSSLKMADDFKGFNWDKKMEHEKSVVSCKVEHPFLIVKRQMGYSKVVYRGIASWNGIWAWYGRLRKKRENGKICLPRKRKRHFSRYQSCVTLPGALRS